MKYLKTGSIRPGTNVPRLEKGRKEERIENAQIMKSLNISTEIIQQVTGLSIEEIEALL